MAWHEDMGNREHGRRHFEDDATVKNPEQIFKQRRRIVVISDMWPHGYGTNRVLGDRSASSTQ
jgi:hypothetical protein